MPTFLVISGPPGAGKSTLARVLADSLDRSVHLAGDAFFSFVRGSFVEPWKSGSRAQNDVIFEAMSAAAVAYLQGGYDVVFDCVVGPWHLKPIVEAAVRARGPLDYVVLRPRLDATVDRARARPLESLRDKQAIRDLHDQFADLGPLEGHVLDSSDLDVDATIRVVQQGLATGQWRIDPVAVARDQPARSIAICVVIDDERLLVAEVPDPSSGRVGYRPLGGSIEAGETPADAVIREFEEEIGAALRVEDDLGVIDNAFIYLGRLGHERVSIVRGRLADSNLAHRDRIPWTEVRTDGQELDPGPLWMPIDAFASGRATIYPDGLLELLRDS